MESNVRVPRPIYLLPQAQGIPSQRPTAVGDKHEVNCAGLFKGGYHRIASASTWDAASASTSCSGSGKSWTCSKEGRLQTWEGRTDILYANPLPVSGTAFKLPRFLLGWNPACSAGRYPLKRLCIYPSVCLLMYQYILMSTGWIEAPSVGDRAPPPPKKKKKTRFWVS